jgi:hypothetical protein
LDVFISYPDTAERALPTAGVLRTDYQAVPGQEEQFAPSAKGRKRVRNEGGLLRLGRAEKIGTEATDQADHAGKKRDRERLTANLSIDYKEGNVTEAELQAHLPEKEKKDSV